MYPRNNTSLNISNFGCRMSSTAVADREPMISKVASHIQSASRICLLVGAGASVNAGIPDFRSAGGLYDTLRPSLLTATTEDRDTMRNDPTWVVNRGLFIGSENPLPYHEVRRPFIAGLLAKKWKPTATHFFFSLMDKHFNKDAVPSASVAAAVAAAVSSDSDSDSPPAKPEPKASSSFTIFDQNIEGLTQIALGEGRGGPDSYVSVHGTMLTIKCEACGKPGPEFAEYAEIVRRNIKDIYQMPGESDPESAPKESNADALRCPHCNKNALKPGTVMYGGSMPDAYFEMTDRRFGPLARQHGQACDLLICVGSSLTVYPAASLPQLLAPNAPLVVVNREAVPVRREYDHLSGDCDETFCQIAAKLGWLPELEKIAAASPPLMAPKSIETVRRVAASLAAKKMAAEDDSL